MGERFRCDAREWLKADAGNILYDKSRDADHGPALVEDLYRTGAEKVEVGGEEKAGEQEADTLFVTLPEDRDSALKVMALLAWQQGDEVEFVDGENDVVRIWWD